MKFSKMLVRGTLASLAVLTLLVCAGAISLTMFGFGVLMTQAVALLVAAPQAKCFAAGITDEQLKEFNEILGSFKGYDGMFKELKELAKMDGGFAAIKQLPDLLKSEQKRNDDLAGEIKAVKKQALLRGTNSGVRYVRGVPFVSDDCALAMAGMFISCAARQDKWSKALGEQEQTLERAAEYLGVTRTALTSSDIPLPTVYVPQIVELVWHYGQFRANATVFPLGAGTVNLPQLKTGEDSFGIIAVSGSVTERKVSAQNVTFTAAKVGGIVRIPTEIEMDTFIPLGQFLARYISRRFAAYEDTFGFLGDGTATYNSHYGVGPYCLNTNSGATCKTLASTKTHPTDATLADFRAMRGLVNAAVFANKPKYYLNPTMDALLVTYNTSATVVPYVRRPDGTATLDGFEIVWVGAMQSYTSAAAASAYIAVFGDLSYWYLGERGQPRVETSREVYFATDEIGIRALERIDVNAMAPDAMSALQCAAS